MKLTPYTQTLATASAQPDNISAAGALVDLFSPGETGEIDRRLALQVMAGLGVAAATTATIWDTAQPKLTSEVVADPFVPETPTREASRLLRKSTEEAAEKSRGIASQHENLFVRRVEVEWKEDYSCDEKSCTKNSDGTETCTTVSKTCTDVKYDSTTIVMDKLIDPVRLEILKRRADFLSKIAAIASELNSTNLKKIEGLVSDINFDGMSDKDFAEHFGFDWQEGQASTTTQTLIAAGIGLPATGIFLFYKQIWEKLKALKDQISNQGRLRSNFQSRFGSWSSSHNQLLREEQRQQGEASTTRRAFLQLACGIGASTLAIGGQERYAARSREIQGDGVQKIRTDITQKNSLNAKQLFLEAFGTNPDTILNEISLQIAALRALTQESVEASIRQGLKDLDAAEKKLYDDMPIGAYGKETTRKDKEFNKQKISAYVQSAHDTADALDSALASLEHLFSVARDKDGKITQIEVPDILLPALKALQVTKAIDASVAEQHSRHNWGLARDIGIMYGVAWGGLLVSEIDGGHHQAVYNVVHGFFDWWDRGKMSAYELMGRMKKQYLHSDYAKIYGSEDLQNAITANVTQLKQAAKDLESIGIVHNPVVENYLRGKDQEKKRRLQEQLDDLDINDVITVYIDKAFAFFAKRQLSVKGLQEAIASQRDYKDSIIKNPPFEEFKAKVIELINDSGATFIFDLIAQGVIDDNEPDEDWISAEAHELNGYINYWANRIAGTVAATTNLYVALNILPKSWWQEKNNPSPQSLTQEDVLDAFRNYARSKLTHDDDRVKMINDFAHDKRTSGRSTISMQELAERALLRVLQNAVQAAQEWEILTEYSPKLKAAIEEKK